MRNVSTLEELRQRIENTQNSPCENSMLHLLYISAMGWLPNDGGASSDQRLQDLGASLSQANSGFEKCKTLMKHMPKVSEVFTANAVTPALHEFGDQKAEEITKMGAHVLTLYGALVKQCSADYRMYWPLFSAAQANAQAKKMDEMAYHLSEFERQHRRCRFLSSDSDSMRSAQEILGDVKDAAAAMRRF